MLEILFCCSLVQLGQRRWLWTNGAFVAKQQTWRFRRRPWRRRMKVKGDAHLAHLNQKAANSDVQQDQIVPHKGY